jgi:hypothetical protein
MVPITVTTILVREQTLSFKLVSFLTVKKTNITYIFCKKGWSNKMPPLRLVPVTTYIYHQITIEMFYTPQDRPVVSVLGRFMLHPSQCSV